MKIDWKDLAIQLGTLEPDGGEFVTNHSGRHAIERIMTAEAIRDAVECYLEGTPGSELANSVLKLIRPFVAIDHCLKIYRSDPSAERRLMAVVLLKDMADPRILEWIPKFLSDPTPGVAEYGIHALQVLLWNREIELEEAEAFIQQAEHHAKADVRETAATIRADRARGIVS